MTSKIPDENQEKKFKDYIKQFSRDQMISLAIGILTTEYLNAPPIVKMDYVLEELDRYEGICLADVIIQHLKHSVLD